MQVKIFKDYQHLSEAASNVMIDTIKQNPHAVLCLASGDTPRLTCRLFVEKITEDNVDLSKVTFIGLDEWVGIPVENEGSCHYFFQHELFQQLALQQRQIHLFDALSNNLANQCARMDNIIREKGGIDLMVVGIGMNGHIGFNEPGVSFDNYSHVIDLDETTISVGQKYFSAAAILHKGITIGLKHLTESKEVILLANGAKKAEVIKSTVEGVLTNAFPASIMQTHTNGIVMIDEEAAQSLTPNPLSGDEAPK